MDDNDKASLNTGYYTKDGLFHSQSGWNECDGKDDASLPQLPANYLTDDYQDVFLSVDNAKQVIDAGKMVPWYAGAARMDAGLTITERLASIAKAHKPDGEDRNLIVCIAASSLPYQKTALIRSCARRRRKRRRTCSRQPMTRPFSVWAISTS